MAHDTMWTLTLSLPLLNPFASMCDSRQDEDGVNLPTRPWNHKSKSARKRGKQRAKKQAAQQRSEPAPDPRWAYLPYGEPRPYSWGCEDLMDGREEEIVLDGSLMVVDAFATYRWDPGRHLWLPMRGR